MFINGHSFACAVKIWLKIALNAVRSPKFEPVNGISWSLRKIMVKDLRQRSRLALFCACAESCDVFNTGPYTVLPDNSILITANMQSETGFPSSHHLKAYVASKSRLKLAAQCARCRVSRCWPSCFILLSNILNWVNGIWIKSAISFSCELMGSCKNVIQWVFSALASMRWVIFIVLTLLVGRQVRHAPCTKLAQIISCFVQVRGIVVIAWTCDHEVLAWLLAMTP